MGTVFQAKCECGFESEEIFAGGGMLNFTEYCGAPAICLKCRKLFVKNYLKDNPKCSYCKRPVIFYDDPSVHAPIDSSEEDNVIFDWRLEDDNFFELPDTMYLCPKCGKMTMEFISIGCWD
ncbi:MAG: hypothetical protein JW984_10505 [Deltaproteobacteria bacterium]|uniref:Uncharacterized protein n=1 Tax=Candidatus Zymogenus saltonus TaxID=2844893 RepID=A0A9D8KG95_9DELT|nr:hypothetical protein [Candidatus Zymogenus saltonus]